MLRKILLSQLRFPALSISVIYIIFGVCWVLFTDAAVRTLFPDPDQQALAQTVKGWLFVACTGLLLYCLVRTYFFALLRSRGELERSEAQNRQLAVVVEQTSECVLLTDADGNVVYANPALLRIIETELALVRGQNLRTLWGKEPAGQALERVCSELAAGKTWNGTWESTSPSGRELRFSGSATPVGDDAERHYAFVFRDITRQMLKERRYRQQEKLESIGTLASGIAHDMNNLLFAISGNTELARLDFGQQVGLSEYLDNIHAAAKRAEELTHQILAFTRSTEKEMQAVRLAPLIKEVLKLVRATVPVNIEIEQRIGTEHDWVLGDPTRLTQILMNLCTNAYQAMETTGGVLAITVESIHLDAADVEAIPGLSPGNYNLLSVRDTGCGMDNTTRERIFEPFYTTKQEGTGLGLATVHGVVRDHQGAVTVYSEPGQGTEFCVYLPQASEAQQVAPPPQPIIPGQGQKVLYVDDDKLIVNVATNMLERIGYRATGCDSAGEALRLLGEHHDGIEAVLMDQMMPQMTGIQLAHELRRRFPDMPLILATGFVNEELERAANRAGISMLLKKPLSLHRLSKALAECLE